MNRVWHLGLIAALLLGGAKSLSAQDVLIENEDKIILPIGIRSWQGTDRELRWINRDAVPASYKARCEREQLSFNFYYGVSQVRCHQDLTRWHFNFGTAQSAEIALDYLGKDLAGKYYLSAKDAARYAELVPQGLSEAEAYLQLEGLTYEQFLLENRVIAAGRYPALAELRALREKLTKSGHIAALYVAAADWYRSPSLLRKAAQWLGYLPDTEVLLVKEKPSDPERLLHRVAQLETDPFLELRYAVAKAATERSEESIVAAHEVSARAHELAFQNEDFRYDRGPEVEPYKYLRFRIQLLAFPAGIDVSRHQGTYLDEPDFSHIDRLMHPEERSVGDIEQLAYPEQWKFIEAIVAQGEHAVQINPDCKDDRYNHVESLNILFNAGRIVSPAHHPAAYRRVAQLYVDLYANLKRCKDQDGDWTSGRQTQYDVQERFYRRFLNNYDEIALGR